MNLEVMVEQVVSGLGYELVDFESLPRPGLLRVFIEYGADESCDGVRKAINVEDCARVSEQLSRVFEVENVDYERLEVSSPGLDRPLGRAADFERFCGSLAQLRLRVAMDGQRNFTGRIVGLEGEAVRLATEAGEVMLALDNLDRARLVPEF